MRSSKVVFYLLLTGILLSGCSAAEGQTAAPAPTATDTPIPATAKLEYIGHACFLLTASDGTRIVMDPYKDYTVSQEIQLFPKGITADAVVLSHFHPDHANWEAIEGARLIYETGSDSVGIVSVTGLAGDHGILNATPVGANTVWIFEIGAIKIVHTGANGVVTQPDILAAMDNADVALMRATGDAGHPVKDIMTQLRELNTRTIIPSHYNHSAQYRLGNGLTVDEFIGLLGPDETVVRMDGSVLEVTAGMPRQVIVLTPSALASQ
jgi:L-ascorbate metabolism protein UlaG (beta-lactamase superfamily)